MNYTIEREMETRLEEVARLRRQVVQRAQQEAALARRRYLQLDPDNRLVADQLEVDGTVNYGTCVRHRRNTNTRRKTSKGSSVRNSGRKSWGSSQIFPECGRLPVFPIGSADGAKPQFVSVATNTVVGSTGIAHPQVYKQKFITLKPDLPLLDARTMDQVVQASEAYSFLAWQLLQSWNDGTDLRACGRLWRGFFFRNQPHAGDRSSHGAGRRPGRRPEACFHAKD